MVSEIHATVDDEQAAEIKRMKDAFGWTWKEYMINTAQMLDDMTDENDETAPGSWSVPEVNE